MRRPSPHPMFASFDFIEGQRTVIEKLLAVGEREQRRQIRRLMMREGMRIVNAMDAAELKKTPAPRPRKRSVAEIVTDATNRQLEMGFRIQPKKTRQDQYRRVAREVGMSVKKLKHVENLLSEMRVQQLLGSGVLTLPRLGRLRLVESEPRRRVVNISGRIGRDGKPGMIEVPLSARVRFRQSRTLKRALAVATDLGLIVLQNLERRRRRRSLPAALRNRFEPTVRVEERRPVTEAIPAR